MFPQPTTWTERQSVARSCCQRLELSMPVVVDSIDNAVDTAYAAWPERIYIIDADGRIAYAGKQGPWGFKPKEAERALDKLLRGG